MEKQMSILREKQVEVDRIKYRAKLEVTEEFKKEIAEREK